MIFFWCVWLCRRKIMESEIKFSEGKFQQQKLLGDFTITDEELEQFLVVNFNHLNLTRGKSQDEDVSLISWYTMKRFMCAIKIFFDLSMIKKDKPEIIPYIVNIVNETSPRISFEPQNFKGKLYPPQAALIKRMLDIESMLPTLTLGDKRLKITGGLVNERLSFGKTFCLPALICEKFKPLCDNLMKENLIDMNLIICGTKVAKEWKKNLSNLTSFKFQIIERQEHLKILEDLINTGNFPEIVVVKDGDITWKNKKGKALDHVLDFEKIKDRMFCRVIYDDYDMLKLKKDSYVPKALFTWFISGTEECFNSQDLNFYYFSNDEVSQIKLSSALPIFDAIASVRCNKEYSVVEYDIPKIDTFTHFGSTLLAIVEKIVNNEQIDCEEADTFIDKSLLTGSKNVPYVYNRQTLKILVAIEDKNDQTKLINDLNQRGIKTVKLTRANVNKYEREDTVVCVSGNLFGVNMGFLTHIVINMTDFERNGFIQIIGRGQRLSRKQNLQVYFHESYSEESFNESED